MAFWRCVLVLAGQLKLIGHEAFEAGRGGVFLRAGATSVVAAGLFCSAASAFGHQQFSFSDGRGR